MNKGIRLAHGEIIGILNADDIYAAPDVLAKVVKVFEDSEIGACYGDLCYIKESQEACKKSKVSDCPLSVTEVVRYWKSGAYNLNKFYWGWMPPHPTFFVRRSVYEQYGLFNIGLGSAADYELMLRFLLRHRVRTAYIPEVLVKMRVGGMSNASIGNRIRANRNDRRAWEVNGLKPYLWTIPLKPIRKIPQYWLRP